MLPRSRRVGKEAFKELLGAGIYKSFKHFSLRIQKVSNDEPSKFSVVVSKKVAPKAVDRNLIKRRVMYVVKTLLPRSKNSYRVAVFVKRGIIKLRVSELSREIADALFQTSLLIDKTHATS